MNTWLETILEIIKITIPALIVYFTINHLLKQYLDKQYQLRVLETKEKLSNTTIPLKLQAYERLTLLMERISVANLTNRIAAKNVSAAGLQAALLIAIQKEYEHNISQQIYVSETLWKIIRIARDTSSEIISGVYEKTGKDASGKTFKNNLLHFVNTSGEPAIEKALSAIKQEVAILIP